MPLTNALASISQLLYQGQWSLIIVLLIYRKVRYKYEKLSYVIVVGILITYSQPWCELSLLLKKVSDKENTWRGKQSIRALPDKKC